MLKVFSSAVAEVFCLAWQLIERYDVSSRALFFIGRQPFQVGNSQAAVVWCLQSASCFSGLEHNQPCIWNNYYFGHYVAPLVAYLFASWEWFSFSHSKCHHIFSFMADLWLWSYDVVPMIIWSSPPKCKQITTLELECITCSCILLLF